VDRVKRSLPFCLALLPCLAVDDSGAGACSKIESESDAVDGDKRLRMPTDRPLIQRSSKSKYNVMFSNAINSKNFNYLRELGTFMERDRSHRVAKKTFDSGCKSR